MDGRLAVTCVVCPVGCEITVANGVEVEGNKCDKGREYALSEYHDPRRVLTSTVRTSCADRPLLPVRTDRPIPKHLLIEAVRLLAQTRVSPPVRAGEVVIAGVLGTDASVIATSDL